MNLALILLSSLSILNDSHVVGHAPCVWKRTAYQCVFVEHDGSKLALVGGLVKDSFTIHYVLRKEDNVLIEVWSYKRIRS